MGNKAIPKTKIFGDGLLKAISEAGYSIRGLAKEIGNVSDRTIRTYLKRNEMPEYLLQKIDDILHPKTRMLYMNIGVKVPVTDEELEYFLSVYNTMPAPELWSDGVCVDSVVEKLMKRDIQIQDGYIPDSVLSEWLMEFRMEAAGVVTLSEYLGRDLVKKNEEGSK